LANKGRIGGKGKEAYSKYDASCFVFHGETG
jgi:hypothetical protein